jgi:hypothetical protein
MTAILQSPLSAVISGKQNGAGSSAESAKKRPAETPVNHRCSMIATRTAICSGAGASLKNTLGLNKCFFSWALEARV